MDEAKFAAAVFVVSIMALLTGIVLVGDMVHFMRRLISGHRSEAKPVSQRTSSELSPRV